VDAEVVLEAVAALGLVQEEPAPFTMNEARGDVGAGRSHRLFAGPRRLV
jgi:hypothetical protein